jgi:uncharacterized protein YdeI (YjbR/CyaY-like superfamily)
MSPITPPTRDEVVIFATAADFRAWLEANHDATDALWVGFYRKGVPKAAMTYPEAVEEALCFGWIDGITYRIDDELRTLRFTPRRKTSSWSARNIQRVAQLRAEGRMHPAGSRAFEERDPHKDAGYSYERPALELPGAWLARFEADPAAWNYWQGEQPSYRRTASHWVLSAKRPETRERRFTTLVADSAAGRRVRPFLVERPARS